MLLEVLLALAGGWLVFILGKVILLFWARRPADGQSWGKLFVLMGGQEDAAEGFLRKLMAWRNRLWPRLEVAVVDCGAGDETGKIIRLLAGELAYPVIEGSFFRQYREQGNGNGSGNGNKETFLYYDARGHKGKDLIGAPLFFFLKVFIKEVA